MAALNDKVVLIAGASGGIGAGTARLLAANGAKVVMGARRSERPKWSSQEIEKSGGVVLFRAVDVSDCEEMEAFVAFAEAEFGRIDVLVNSAGLLPSSPLSKFEVEDWNWMIDVNIRGVLYGIAAVLPRMEAQGRGHIINVSAVGGCAVRPTGAVHSEIKFAVREISRELRKANDKIRCTCVYPSVVESDLADRIGAPFASEQMRPYRKLAFQPDAIARAIQRVIEQPYDLDVNEMAVQPPAAYS